jgi:hypothetical protein
MTNNNFSVGDRVVCVNDEKPKDFKAHHYPNWVKKDEVYHIRRVVNNDDIVTGVLLNEIKNPLLLIPLINAIQEGAFAQWRFETIKSAYLINEEINVKEQSFKDFKRKKSEEKKYLQNEN